MNTTVLSPAAADALSRAYTNEKRITPPHIDRVVYREVYAALAGIGGGGRWNPAAAAFVFRSDPRPELAALIAAATAPAGTPGP